MGVHQMGSSRDGVFRRCGFLEMAVRVRAQEVGQGLAELLIEQQGYHLLAAPDETRQHNELPATALRSQDAMAELIRYLEGGSAAWRDRLAQSLGLT